MALNLHHSGSGLSKVSLSSLTLLRRTDRRSLKYFVLLSSNFENVSSATYGACYSINSNLSGEATSLLRSSLPGPDLGLTIVVNLDQVQYLQNRITKNAGAR